MPSNEGGTCWACGQTLEPSAYTREGECPKCRKQTHVCRNCRFFAPGLANSCREPVAEHVTDKERANFCDYFQPAGDTYQESADADALRSAAEDLFKS